MVNTWEMGQVRRVVLGLICLRRSILLRIEQVGNGYTMVPNIDVLYNDDIQQLIANGSLGYSELPTPSKDGGVDDCYLQCATL
jgi:hypothetical protein